MAGAYRHAWLCSVFAGLVTLGCGDSDGPAGAGGQGSITLAVPTQSPDAFLFTDVRILARGATDTAVTVAPGGELTISGLLAGTYTVAVEGLSSEEVYGFGQASNVTVQGGGDTRIAVTLDVFFPTVAPPQPDSVVGKSLPASFSAVPGAVAYEVQAALPLDDGSLCCNTVPDTVTTTSAEVLVPDYAYWVVVVRAFDAYGGHGRYSRQATPIRSVPATVLLIDCPVGGEADPTGHGFYIPSYPGTRLSQVDLYVSADVAGSYALTLETRESEFDALFIDSPGATAELTADPLNFQKVSFVYDVPTFYRNHVVTFDLHATGPGTLFFEVPHDDPSCPVVETEDTQFPLSTFRRHGVHLSVTGGAP